MDKRCLGLCGQMVSLRVMGMDYSYPMTFLHIWSCNRHLTS